jgi:hypothetical protein
MMTVFALFCIRSSGSTTGTDRARGPTCPHLLRLLLSGWPPLLRKHLGSGGELRSGGTPAIPAENTQAQLPTKAEAQPTPHHRPVAALPTIDATLTSASPVAYPALSVSFRWSRRILANVFCKSVLKLVAYRNDGSRIDCVWPHAVSSASIENSLAGTDVLRMRRGYPKVIGNEHSDGANRGGKQAVWVQSADPGDSEGAVEPASKYCTDDAKSDIQHQTPTAPVDDLVVDISRDKAENNPSE